MADFHLRRSALYVPASNQRAVDKAAGLKSDVLILDLEDSVAPSQKELARSQIGMVVRRWREQGFAGEIVVRVNGLDTPWGRDDLLVAGSAGADALLLPKISTATDLHDVRTALGNPHGGRTSLWAMIETPRAVLDPLAITMTQDEGWKLSALVLGLNDLARETRTRQVPGRAPMLPWMMQALAAARAARIDIIDGVYNDIADSEGFEAECAAARQCGFDGKTVVHPLQIEPANRAFSPDPAELALAEQIAGLFDRPENENRGVVMVDGRMIERLHAEMAKITLAIQAEIVRRG